MKLKSGCIFWPQIYPGPVPEFSRLERDTRCDVAIIGAGISGALVAHHLVAQGVHTVMVDRRPTAQGSTAASTGLLQYEIDTPLIDLIQCLGRQHAVDAYRASLQSVEAFEPLVADLGDRCGLTPRISLYLAARENDLQHIRDECEARQSMGIDVRFLSRQTLQDQFNLARPAALLSAKAFDVDPYHLTLRLISKSIQRGLEVFIPTQVDRCEPTSDGMTLHTADGPRIQASKVVFATGYETMDFLPRDLCRLASTYALASQPIDDFSSWPQRCLIWETARPYLYLRTTPDNRAIVGGEDVDIVEAEARDRLLPQKTRTLAQRFAELMPEIKIEVDCAWAGTFAQTKDGLPFIGSMNNLPHAYFALGYGGNGITFSLLAAQIITDLFLGRPNPNAALFRFDR
jgi:glycine/D-amino acid oxidase-like deaminating enzyme